MNMHPKNSATDVKVKLSSLWIVAMLNYLYCDVVTLMDAHFLQQFLNGNVGGMNFTPGFLLAASVLMEIPILMIFLSRALKYKINRWANIGAGTFMTIIQLLTLFSDVPTPYYMFFSVVEIACTVLITWSAWKWAEN